MLRSSDTDSSPSGTQASVFCPLSKSKTARAMAHSHDLLLYWVDMLLCIDFSCSRHFHNQVNAAQRRALQADAGVTDSPNSRPTPARGLLDRQPSQAIGSHLQVGSWGMSGISISHCAIHAVRFTVQVSTGMRRTAFATTTRPRKEQQKQEVGRSSDRRHRDSCGIVARYCAYVWSQPVPTLRRVIKLKEAVVSLKRMIHT